MIYRVGDRGDGVRSAVQYPLSRLGYALVQDGIYGPATKAAVEKFQRANGLTVDGVFGPLSSAMAAALLTAGGAEVVDTVSPFPPMSPGRRETCFGKFKFEPNGGDNIRILGGWEADNIQRFRIPQLDGVPYYTPTGKLICNGDVRLHKLAGPIFLRFFERVEHAGLLGLVRTFDGAFVPRFVRGSKVALSNHSWGTAIDINAYANGLGKRPAGIGADGSLLKLVPLAHECGLYWGGNFSRPDGMHFEVAVLP